MVYNIGDSVTIRKDLALGAYGTNLVVQGMLRYRSFMATISYLTPDEEYLLDIDDGCYSWTEEMFEKPEPLPPSEVYSEYIK